MLNKSLNLPASLLALSLLPACEKQKDIEIETATTDTQARAEAVLDKKELFDYSFMFGQPHTDWVPSTIETYDIYGSIERIGQRFNSEGPGVLLQIDEYGTDWSREEVAVLLDRGIRAAEATPYRTINFFGEPLSGFLILDLIEHGISPEVASSVFPIIERELNQGNPEYDVGASLQAVEVLDLIDLTLRLQSSL